MWYQFVSWALKKMAKIRKMLDIEFVLTPCIISNFTLISKVKEWNIIKPPKELLYKFFICPVEAFFNMSEQYYNCHFLWITLYELEY